MDQKLTYEQLLNKVIILEEENARLSSENKNPKFEVLEEELKATLEINESLKKSYEQNFNKFRETEENLLKKTAFFEAMINATQNGILITDINSKKVFQNQKMVDFFEIPYEYANNVDDTDQLNYVTNLNKDPEKFINRVKYLTENPDEISEDKIELKNGKTLLRYSSPVYDTNKHYYGRIWSFIDITKQIESQEKLKIANEELMNLNNSKDKFFSIISHDLRGPIGNIANLFNEMKVENLNHSIWNMFRVSIQSTYELVEDLLTWSRTQRNYIDFEPKNFSVLRVFKQVCHVLQSMAQQKNIELEIKNNEDEIFAFADVSSIKTVIRNLVSNAIKFTYEGGKVILSASIVNDKVKISITDTGVGISLYKLAKIFQLGKKISSPGTNNEKGSGLGLQLCKEYVELNEGEIGVESDLNKGSTFWFTLPIGEKFDVNNILQQIREKNLEALIVEDNFLNLENAINELSKANIRYDIAKDSLEAIQKGCNKQYDFILMDINLKGESGIEVNNIIRDKYRDAKIFSLSSFNKNEILAKDNKVFFDDYFNKPLNIENLLYTLEKLFVNK